MNTIDEYVKDDLLEEFQSLISDVCDDVIQSTVMEEVKKVNEEITEVLKLLKYNKNEIPLILDNLIKIDQVVIKLSNTLLNEVETFVEKYNKGVEEGIRNLLDIKENYEEHFEKIVSLFNESEKIADKKLIELLDVVQSNKELLYEAKGYIDTKKDEVIIELNKIATNLQKNQEDNDSRLIDYINKQIQNLIDKIVICNERVLESILETKKLQETMNSTRAEVLNRMEEHHSKVRKGIGMNRVILLLNSIGIIAIIVMQILSLRG